MEQVDINPSKVLASQPILSPHIAGWFFPSAKSLNAEANINAMQQAMNTSLPLTELVTKELSCTSTDSIYQEQSSTVTITGYPRWTEPVLATAAIEKNHAYALYLAYTQYDSQFLDYLQGAFAFSIIDSSSNQLLAGTDRLGQSPLYYTKIHDGVVFGSSVSTILA